MLSRFQNANASYRSRRNYIKSFPGIFAMAQSKNSLQADREFHLVSVSPLARLARCVTTEETLENLAWIAMNKGIALHGIRLTRAGLSREWKAQETVALDEEVPEIEVRVEGGQTRLVLLFTKSLDSDVRCEIEDAAYMAVQRVELCERQIWAGEEKGKQSTPEINGMIGNSNPMQALKRSIKAAAECNSTTLIIGESGTGKELAAHAIHHLGARKENPFIPINCGAFTESLLESELFGYVKGAFTGALANRKGLFESANGGTIFLDEIGEMPITMQVKLLRVLQEQKVRPVGAHYEIDIDVRVIAATNRDLRNEVKEKRFREDLFYRLYVLPIFIPPLKEHSSDLALLVEHFLEKIANKLRRKHPIKIEAAAIYALSDYSWPGNVRELENIIERLIVESRKSDVITVEQVRHTIGANSSIATESGNLQYIGVLREGESLDEHFARQQIQIYEMVLAQAGGNHSQAARWLGMERTALYHKLERARQRLSA